MRTAPLILLLALLLTSTSALPQVAQQTYLRDKPNGAEEDARIQAVIARAENHFKLGELSLKDGKREQARDEFDKAVDAVLESGLDVRAHPRLMQFYIQLIERVYRVEVPPEQAEDQKATKGSQAAQAQGLARAYSPLVSSGLRYPAIRSARRLPLGRIASSDTSAYRVT